LLKKSIHFVGKRYDVFEWFIQSLKCLALSDWTNHSKTAQRLPTKWIDFFKPSRSVHRSTRATEVKKSSQFDSKSKRDI
ncbi:hypothetical protein LN615_20390, partial [Proteus terrae]|uniref:hypothetical protein n=1 Tax=Proteus terrae TaxID=1574161 RepID=UPI00207CACA4